MLRYTVSATRLVVGLAILSMAILSVAVLSAPLAAQSPPVLGDHDSPLRSLGGDNVGLSNAVLREQDDVRVLRVVVEAGGQRVLHAHATVQFHMFVPISGPMTLDLADGRSVEVRPWHPYYLPAGTRHGFRNNSSEPVEIMEIFIR